MYAMTMTRPDLGYALSMVSRSCTNPNSSHVAAVVQILRYARGTLHYGLTYTKGQPGFVGYTDADWSGAIDGRQLTAGWLFMMRGAPISWSSKRQASVSQSSCESEYYALSGAGKEGVWLRLLLQELGHISAAPTVIWADNQGAIALAENPEFHKRTKHIDTKFHWVREVIERGVLLLEFLPTRFMAADGLTKPLPPKQFQRFLAMIGMA